jgi:hypothetical protein
MLIPVSGSALFYPRSKFLDPGRISVFLTHTIVNKLFGI